MYSIHYLHKTENSKLWGDTDINITWWVCFSLDEQYKVLYVKRPRSGITEFTTFGWQNIAKSGIFPESDYFSEEEIKVYKYKTLEELFEQHPDVFIEMI